MLVKWLNLAGLVFQFVAFWFAAPELLGADTLKRFENGLVKTLSQLPGILLGVAGFAVGTGLGIYGMYTGMQGDATKVVRAMIWIGVLFGLYLIFMIFYYKRLQHYLKHRVAEPLLQMLIANNEARKTALVVGAILFTVGFIAQLMAITIA